MAVVIAEIGSNWDPGRPRESLREMVEAAAGAGANVVKVQDWHPFGAMDRPAEWKERSGRWTLTPRLRNVAKNLAHDAGIGFLASAFTGPAATRAVMEEHIIKVASSEIGNHALLRHIKRRGRDNPPLVFLSLGEVDAAPPVYMAYASLGAPPVVLMACVSEYPVGRPLDLLDSLTFAQQFGLPVGVSSHVVYPDCIPILEAAVRRGAGWVEAHLRVPGVTPDDAPDNGPWALAPHEFAEMVRVVREVGQ